MKIELDLQSNKDCDDISISIYCNNDKIFESKSKKQLQTVRFELPDDPAKHKIILTMSGKTRKHTRVDNQNIIIDDVYFSLERLEFEELDMRTIFCQGHTCYKHDFNSSQAEFIDEFYGIMGCNGSVEICFETPIFLWLSQYID
jgi:hypothetical protein